MHQNAFGGRTCWRGLQHSPRPPSWITGREREGSGKGEGEGGVRGGKRKREEVKGRTPQCLKCVDANGPEIIL